MDLFILKREMEKKNIDGIYIQKCIEYAQNLKDKGLPIIFDIKHFSMLMGLKSNELYGYYKVADILYKKIRIPKKMGGSRELSIPSENLKYIQRWILDHILYKCEIHDSACGFVKNKSIVDNAKKHVQKECVINLDIKDFFPTIQSKQIFFLFRGFGYSEHLSRIFTGLCTYSRVLPQGAPTSPYLSNLICLKLDERFQELAENIGASYSRYADDITFSGNKSIRKYIALFKNIIKSEGFSVNEKKVRVQFQYHSQMVTGIIVNEKLSVPQKTKSYLRQQIYYCRRYGVKDNLRKQEIFKSNYKDHLYGLAYFIKMVESQTGLVFLAELNEIDWES